MQIVNLATRMGHARCFAHATIGEDFIVTGEMLCITFRRLCCAEIYVAAAGKSQDFASGQYSSLEPCVD